MMKLWQKKVLEEVHIIYSTNILKVTGRYFAKLNYYLLNEEIWLRFLQMIFVFSKPFNSPYY